MLTNNNNYFPHPEASIARFIRDYEFERYGLQVRIDRSNLWVENFETIKIFSIQRVNRNVNVEIDIYVTAEKVYNTEFLSFFHYSGHYSRGGWINLYEEHSL